MPELRGPDACRPGLLCVPGWNIDPAPETNCPLSLCPLVAQQREAALTVQTRDLRRSRRTRVLIRATLISTEGVQEVRVKDLTSDGAGVCCQVPLERGTDVILKRGDLFVAARVVWVDGANAGLSFYRSVCFDDSPTRKNSPAFA